MTEVVKSAAAISGHRWSDAGGCPSWGTHSLAFSFIPESQPGTCLVSVLGVQLGSSIQPRPACSWAHIPGQPVEKVGDRGQEAGPGSPPTPKTCQLSPCIRLDAQVNLLKKWLGGWAFPDGSQVNSPANAGDMDSIPDGGRSHKRQSN